MEVEPSDTGNLAIVFAVLAIFILGWILLPKSKIVKDGYGYPPRAPVGTWETLRKAASSDYPWWLLEVAHELKSGIFRLALPIPGAPMVVAVGEGGAFRQIMTDPLTRKPRLYEEFRPVNGGTATLFSSFGNAWHAKRKAVAPAFASKHVRRMNDVALAKVESWMEGRLRPAAEAGDSIDFDEEILHVILSAISETAFEYSMSKEESSMFISELELALTEFALKAPSNPLRKFVGMLLPERRRAFAAGQNLRRLSLTIIASYRKLEAPLHGTIIDLLMRSTAFKDDGEKAAQIVEFLVGGHDTTAHSIAWTLLELARNPVEQVKLRDSLTGLAQGQMGNSDYLAMVIKEAMRLHPVAAASTYRQIGRDMVTNGTYKYFLPKNSIVILPFLVQFRDSLVFDQPDLFKPSRWENPTKEMIDAMHPFSFGKQNCVGQSLASAQMKAILPKICSEFELTVEDEGRADFFLTMKPAGVLLKAKQVQS